MRPIVAYHPMVHVADEDGTRHIITAELPDFEQDDELMGRMARLFGVQTAGEVVREIREHPQTAERILAKAGIYQIRIEKSSSPDDKMKVFSCDERVA